MSIFFHQFIMFVVILEKLSRSEAFVTKPLYKNRRKNTPNIVFFFFFGQRRSSQKTALFRATISLVGKGHLLVYQHFSHKNGSFQNHHNLLASAIMMHSSLFDYYTYTRRKSLSYNEFIYLSIIHLFIL